MPLTPEQSDALFLEYTRGTLPLLDLPAAFGLSIDEFIQWAESPEITRRLDAMEAIAHRRTRLAAATGAAPAVELLNQLVEAAAQEQQDPDEDPAASIRRRLARDQARKSAAAIIALGKPPRPRKQPDPAEEQSETAGGGIQAASDTAANPMPEPRPVQLRAPAEPIPGHNPMSAPLGLALAAGRAMSPRAEPERP